jgi:hypothetical protein
MMSRKSTRVMETLPVCFHLPNTHPTYHLTPLVSYVHSGRTIYSTKCSIRSASEGNIPERRDSTGFSGHSGRRGARRSRI